MGDARILSDNTSQDQINHVSWWERRKQEATAGPNQAEDIQEWGIVHLPEFLIPVADFSDESGVHHTFGITVFRVDEPSTYYVRSGNFERLILPAGILERFPQQVITIE